MNLRLLLLAAPLAALLSTCDKEDNFITDGSARLEFSLDTLRFDTVFTEVGSATRLFKVYNRNDRPVRISRIFLEGRAGRVFRLNVDGDPGNEAENVEVPGNDSIYVFAEVTIDPDQPLSVSPFVIEDRVHFITNDNEQIVHLEAWGQNANYIPSRFARGVPSLLTCANGEITWDDPKPYVIYGVLFIDSCALNLPAGARLYVHGGVARNEVFGTFNDGLLYVLANGRLRVNGTPERPVVIQGDRLEEEFREEPGQWTGVVIGKGSRGNRIEWAAVKNGIFGVYVDSAATLEVRNTRFYNTSSSGIVGFHSTITAENCLVYNNFSNAVQLLNGGDYRFTYCTVASYGVNAAALAMSNFYCYDNPTECRVRSIYRLRATFVNSIFFGSRRDELILSDISGGQDPALFNLSFQNCVVRVDELLRQQNSLYADFFDTTCLPCLNGTREDRLFIDPDKDDYHLDSLSIAIGQGRPVTTPRLITIDLENNPRDPQMPDIGCFERQ